MDTDEKISLLLGTRPLYPQFPALRQDGGTQQLRENNVWTLNIKRNDRGGKIHTQRANGGHALDERGGLALKQTLSPPVPATASV
ncbi:hypothetical protein Q8A67_000904 [Cirrhinus molitorella]|uniref:Uncharacterized protein n=1 Tax=Cirrhinus molitorella TaxID=172907 RepID=A0AA88QGQ7_9TELE|nr:hypothetical protein Q8A67_000904 [Cirrhinus molitorella]